MDAPNLADKMAKQPLSRNARVIPKRATIHPAMKQAHDVFTRLHSGKFAQNAGRGFKKKAK